MGPDVRWPLVAQAFHRGLSCPSLCSLVARYIGGEQPVPTESPQRTTGDPSPVSIIRGQRMPRRQWRRARATNVPQTS